MHKNAGETYLDDAPYCVFPMCTVYRDSSLETIIYTPSTSPSLQEPFYSFENYDDTSTFGNTLVNGEYTYFYFKVQKKDELTPFPCGFYFHDVTNFNIPYDTYVNDSTSVFIDLNEHAGVYSSPNYLYKYNEDSDYVYYAVPCTLPLGTYNNFSSYQITLFVIDTNNDNIRYEKNYTWSTNFSTSGITKQEQNKNDNMLSNINSFRDFFNKNTYDPNSSILQMFPSNSQYSSPTDNGINTIFNSFYNAFTNSNTVTVRFYVPFCNDQYFDIPSDLVSSHLPSSILIIIQSFYWFIICRFIVKDIAKYAQKAKSGDILESNSDNIKTDLL